MWHAITKIKNQKSKIKNTNQKHKNSSTPSGAPLEQGRRAYGLRASFYVFDMCLLSFIFYFLFFSCAHTPSKKAETVEVPSGVNIPAMGLAIDVSYDPRLDNIIPGFKILNVAIANNSVDVIGLDPANDKWMLEDARGKKTQALTGLRSSEPELWQSLPERLRGLIEYQLVIPIGATAMVDLLFKKDARLEGFRSLTFDSSSLGKKFKILAREK